MHRDSKTRRNALNEIRERELRQPKHTDPDKVVEQLEKVAFERYGNDGMGGEMVVNMDDAIEIVKGGGVDAN